MNKVLERVTGHGNGMGTEGVSLVLVLVFECLLFAGFFSQSRLWHQDCQAASTECKCRD